MFVLNTLSPYEELDRKGIQYSVHNPEDSDRFVALENANPVVENNVQFVYHNVTPDEENRLDVIAQNCLGSASYSWAIAYFNNIQDGFTCRPGQKLRMPRSIVDLMTTGNIMESVPAVQLNLGSED